MSRVLLLLAAFALWGAFVPSVLCDQEIYMGGFFLMSHYDDDGLEHIASISGYMPDDADFDDKFRGGVLSSYYVQPGGTALPCHPNVLASTPFGIFGAGDFAWIEGEYSNSIAMYDVTSGTWGPVNDGVWTDLQQSTGGPSVDYITSLTNIVVVGGDFSYVEDYVVYCNNNNITDSKLPGLVGYDPNSGNWRPLPGEGGPDSLETNSFIYGLTSDGTSEVYFAYGGTLFAWNQDQAAYRIIAEELNVPNGCLVYSGGKVFALDIQTNGNTTDASLSYWDVSDGTDYHIVVASYQNGTDASRFLLTEYEGGVVYAIPDQATQETEELFAFSLGSNTSSVIPSPSQIPKQLLWPGSANLWAVTSAATASTEAVWYFNGITWEKVSTDSVEYDIYTPGATINNGQFYAYGRELENSTNKFFTLSTSGQYNFLDSGAFTNPGFVTAMASMLMDNSLEIYVSGYFDYVGDGDNQVASQHFARYTDDWDAISYPYPINDLAALNDTLYVVYFNWEGTTFPLDIYSVDSQDFVGFSGTLPTVDTSARPAFVRSMYVDRENNQIFFGGDFHAIVDGNDIYGVIGLDLNSMSWFGVGLPESSGTQFTSYNAMTTYEQGGYRYLFVGGEFEIANLGQGQYTYTNAYLYDLTNMTNVQIAPPPSQVALTFVLNFSNTTLYVSSIEAVQSSVMSFDTESGAWDFVGDLKDDTTSLLTYTSSNVTELFAGLGAFDGSSVGYGFSTFNLTDPSASWHPEGEQSILEASGINSMGEPYTAHFFIGGMNVMMYESGGVVEPYYATSEFSSSNSPHNGWWISLLVIGILLIALVVVIGIAGAAFFVYKKKRTTYQEIMDS